MPCVGVPPNRAENVPQCPAKRTEVSAFRRKRAVRNRVNRASEAMLRGRLLTALEAARSAGLPMAEARRCAGVSAGTWRNWARWRRAGEPALPPRGRRPRCATRSERAAAIGFLAEHGRLVPLRAVREHLPGVARAELADCRRRYSRICQWKINRHRGRLTWKRVGAVWAIDFTEPAQYIDGTDRWILAIRDLASGYQLAWTAFTQATAECVIETLRTLFERHGAPLVLKSDNGCQFLAGATLILLAEWSVTPLFSPPRRPAYNGGLERTHPILKCYTQAAAQSKGRPEAPRAEDLVTAQGKSNRFTYRGGPSAPSADELWSAREPLTKEERSAFISAVRERREHVRQERGYAAGETLNHYQQAAVDRRAIGDTLVAHNLLEIRPRRKKRGARKRANDHARRPTRAALPSALTSASPSSASFTPSLPLASTSEENRESSAAERRAGPDACRITLQPRASPPVANDAPSAGQARGDPGRPTLVRRLITPLKNWLRRAMIR